MCRSLFHSCLAVALLLSTIAVAPAQAPRNDLLEQNKLLSKVNADKMEQEVSNGLAESRKLAATDPAKAIAALKLLQGRLEADTALTEARRGALVRMVVARVQTMQTTAAALERTAPRKPLGGEDDAKVAQGKAIARTLDQIDKMKRDGRGAEAARMAAELVRANPDNPAAQAAARTTGTVGTLVANQESRGDGTKGFTGAMAGVDKSAATVTEDMSLPKDWFKKMEARKNINAPVLSAKELAILKALKANVNVDYDKAGFFDVLQDLSDKMGVSFIPDRASLEAVGVTSDSQVSLKFPRGINARTAIRKMLGDLGLTYIIKHEAIQIVTEAKAKDTLTTRVYYVGNLLAGGSFNDAGIRFVPWLDQIQAMQNINNLLNVIQATVSPDSWQANGGLGTITFLPQNMSIIVRQTAEMHGVLGGMYK